MAALDEKMVGNVSLKVDTNNKFFIKSLDTAFKCSHLLVDVANLERMFDKDKGQRKTHRQPRGRIVAKLKQLPV